jgi:23S rRNA pseudouridine2605 synthase
MVAEGRVRVNGLVVRELGAKADPFKDKVELDGKRVVAETPVYIVVHKPRGVVSTMNDPEGRPSMKEILDGIGKRVFPVGRLDFATSGVLLATNDGEFADALLHPKKAVPKTYIVKVKGLMKLEDLARWQTGVKLEDGVTLPAEAKLVRHEVDKTWFELTIREGRNQQIRRMGDATGFTVMRLARMTFAGISSEDLRPGAWRGMTRDELLALKKEYGVPKKVSAAPVEVAFDRRKSRVPQVDGHGRAQPRDDRSHRSAERGPSRARGGAPNGGRAGDRVNEQRPARGANHVQSAHVPDGGRAAGRGRERERDRRPERGPARGGDRPPVRGSARTPSSPRAAADSPPTRTAARSGGPPRREDRGRGPAATNRFERSPRPSQSPSRESSDRAPARPGRRKR